MRLGSSNSPSNAGGDPAGAASFFLRLGRKASASRLYAGSVATLRERVKADLEAGRLWKARDRLAGVLRVDPTNQWALDQLGDVHYRMGDLPEAGRAWFLTARTGPEWDAAEAAFYERYGNRPANLVAALRVRAPIDRFPPAVQERLGLLQRRLKAEGRFWEPRVSVVAPVSAKRSLMSGALGGAVVILLLGALLIGLVSIVGFVIGLLTGR